MRLWHETLIQHLPREQLLGQHRECCALRGNGWKKQHTTINYIFKYDYYYLFLYHCLVMEEMEKRNYHPNVIWKNPYYRGKNCKAWDTLYVIEKQSVIYPEHHEQYLQECLDNLKTKGIMIQM